MFSIGSRGEVAEMAEMALYIKRGYTFLFLLLFLYTYFFHFFLSNSSCLFCYLYLNYWFLSYFVTKLFLLTSTSFLLHTFKQTLALSPLPSAYTYFIFNLVGTTRQQSKLHCRYQNGQDRVPLFTSNFPANWHTLHGD